MPETSATQPCTHTPYCPPADSPAREAAQTVVSRPEQGWSRLCNGLFVFEDTGELLPDGRVIAPHRPTDALDSGEENVFVAYMEAFKASNEHWAKRPDCFRDRACEVGDPIHARFFHLQDRYKATQTSDIATA